MTISDPEIAPLTVAEIRQLREMIRQVQAIITTCPIARKIAE